MEIIKTMEQDRNQLDSKEYARIMYESIDDKIGQLEMLKEKYFLYLSQANYFHVQVGRYGGSRKKIRWTQKGASHWWRIGLTIAWWLLLSNFSKVQWTIWIYLWWLEFFVYRLFALFYISSLYFFLYFTYLFVYINFWILSNK